MVDAIAAIEKELEEQVAFLQEQGKILQAARLEERTHYDIESMRRFAGIELMGHDIPDETTILRFHYVPPEEIERQLPPR